MYKTSKTNFKIFLLILCIILLPFLFSWVISFNNANISIVALIALLIAICLLIKKIRELHDFKKSIEDEVFYFQEAIEYINTCSEDFKKTCSPHIAAFKEALSHEKIADFYEAAAQIQNIVNSHKDNIKKQEEATKKQKEQDFRDEQYRYYKNYNEKHESQRNTKAYHQSAETLDTAFFAGCDSLDKLNARYKKLSQALHPDNPSGDAETFKQMSAEYEKKKKIFK